MAKIEIEHAGTANEKVVTLVEAPSSMGDKVLVCIHNPIDDPLSGTVAVVCKTYFVRAARMISVPYSDEVEQKEQSTTLDEEPIRSRLTE